jgi:hypothetical protein
MDISGYLNLLRLLIYKDFNAPPLFPVLKEKFNCIYNYASYIFKKEKGKKIVNCIRFLFVFNLPASVSLLFFVSYER